MIKFTQGWIANANGERADIVVRAKAPNTLRDTLIGGGITLVGIAYLTYTAFRHGAKCFEDAENRTMIDLDIM